VDEAKVKRSHGRARCGIRGGPPGSGTPAPAGARDVGDGGSTRWSARGPGARLDVACGLGRRHNAWGRGAGWGCERP